MIGWLLMATAALAACLQGTIKQGGSGEPLSDTAVLINGQSITTDASLAQRTLRYSEATLH